MIFFVCFLFDELSVFFMNLLCFNLLLVIINMRAVTSLQQILKTLAEELLLPGKERQKRCLDVKGLASVTGWLFRKSLLDLVRKNIAICLSPLLNRSEAV